MGYPLSPLLRHQVADPETPWRISPHLYTRVKNSPPSGSSGAYRKCEVLPTDPEYRFILNYFQASPPTNRHIKCAYVIHNADATKQFEASIPSLEEEAKNKTFEPHWDKEDNVPLRESVMERWKAVAGIFSPFSIPQEGPKEAYTHTKVIPLCHGSKQDVCESICATGFSFFGKHHHFKNQASGAHATKSTDCGFFGSGIYLTNSPKYAADIYSSEGHLMIAWTSMRAPYPVISDQSRLSEKCSDMKKLEGMGAYQNYTAHYIPVASINPRDPRCPIYHPCPMGILPSCDEYVFFQKAHILPRFWVELAVSLLPSPVISCITSAQIPHHLSPMVFGKEKWQCFGDVGEEPPLPSALVSILSRPGIDNHLLVLIPKTVNGRPFSLNLLGELMQNPIQGHATKYKLYGEELKALYGDRGVTSSYWILIPKDIFPLSRNKNYQNQCEIVENHYEMTTIPYRVPRLLEATTTIILEHALHGEKLCSNKPWTYNRCEEQIGSYHLVVGGFSLEGLTIDDPYDDNEDIGVSGVWELPSF